MSSRASARKRPRATADSQCMPTGPLQNDMPPMRGSIRYSPAMFNVSIKVLECLKTQNTQTHVLMLYDCSPLRIHMRTRTCVRARVRGAGGGVFGHVQHAGSGKHTVGVCEDGVGARGGGNENAGRGWRPWRPRSRRRTWQTCCGRMRRSSGSSRQGC